MEMSSDYLCGSVTKTFKCIGLSALLSLGILIASTFFVNGTLLYYAGGIFFLTTILSPAVATHWKDTEKISANRKAVFITGCDSGFGHMLAQRLDDIGFHVFAGCLFPEGNGAKLLRERGSNRLHVISLDVTSDSSVQKAVTFVKDKLGDNSLWAVVNNAGIAVGGEIAWISMDAIQRILEVNTLGVVRVTKGFLKELKESKGRVITVASLAGLHATYGLVPYCMSKAAAISFCDGLRLELHKWGVQVIAINPAAYRTPIAEAEKNAELIMEQWNKAPQEVKEMFGSNYIENYIKKANFFSQSHSRHPSEVVSIIEEAITELYPQYSYYPASFALKVLLWFSDRLPKPLAVMIEVYLASVTSE